MLKLPYGISDFDKIITENYYYVDRTSKIRAIEDAGAQLLFLRPRRFGKSLLLSMLENYYDLAKADQFERLFGHLAIGQNPTPKHHQYFMLKWDFSMVSAWGDMEQIQRNLFQHVNTKIEEFSQCYQTWLPHPIAINPTNAIDSFQRLLAAVHLTPYRLYLLIDEYDNFANELLMGQEVTPERYKTLLHGEGVLKALFKAVKAGGAGMGLDRVFITGVSPVVMSDLTSGYNVAENIYLKSPFNDLCGFNETEIETALQQIIEVCGLPSEKAQTALEMMRTFYNGYAFTYKANQLVYNPTLALYFLKSFQQDCVYPRKILDMNLAMDRGKLQYIARLPHGDQLIAQALTAQPPVTISELADRFGVDDMLYATKSQTFMASLLYYFGVLTMAGEDPVWGELILEIPNLVIRRLYAESLQEMLWPNFQDEDTRKQIIRTFYGTGNIQPLTEFIEQHYFKALDNRDYRWANELSVKLVFLTLLFNDTFYIMDSESSLERTYADLTMIIRPDMRRFKLQDFLFEFKYVSLKEVALSGEQVKAMSLAELQELPLVKQRLTEAKQALTGYGLVLAKVYGDQLRLRSYSVVAIGFERLVGEEN